jgi:hypothetical protein
MNSVYTNVATVLGSIPASSPPQRDLRGGRVKQWWLLKRTKLGFKIGIIDNSLLRYKKNKVQKENFFFFIYKEIQKGSDANSYLWKGFLIYEELLVIYEEAVSHMTLNPIPCEFSYEENFIFLFNSACTFASTDLGSRLTISVLYRVQEALLQKASMQEKTRQP